MMEKMKKPLLIKCGIAILILIWLGVAAYFYIYPPPMRGFKTEVNKANQFVEGFFEKNGRLPSQNEYWSKYGSGDKIEYIVDGNSYFLKGWDGDYTWKYSSETKKYEKLD